MATPNQPVLTGLLESPMSLIAEGAIDLARITVIGTATTKTLTRIHIIFFEERIVIPRLLLQENVASFYLSFE
jgi:hypothetical protein